jgi:hypothetical protein
MWDTCVFQRCLHPSFGSSCLEIMFPNYKVDIFIVGRIGTFLWWMKIQTWNDVTCQVVGCTALTTTGTCKFNINIELSVFTEVDNNCLYWWWRTTCCRRTDGISTGRRRCTDDHGDGDC